MVWIKEFYNNFQEIAEFLKETVLKPTLVNELSKLKFKDNCVEGTRQNDSVPSE